jgi:hypothetical protein
LTIKGFMMRISRKALVESNFKNYAHHFLL